MIVHFIRPLDRARHPGCTVHPSATNARERKAICLIRRPWLVWNQDLAISPRMSTKAQLTQAFAFAL